jgi:hypothetical protein
MTASQTSVSIGDKIVQLRIEHEQRNKTVPTHIVIGRTTFYYLQREFYEINYKVLPGPGDKSACELMGMLFSFINSENYLAVR